MVSLLSIHVKAAKERTEANNKSGNSKNIQRKLSAEAKVLAEGKKIPPLNKVTSNLLEDL